jgi:AraC-like DNA-binding protein
MQLSRHIPGPPLGQFVDWFWYYTDLQPLLHRRQHVLPDGGFELVINLQDDLRKLYERGDPLRHQSFRRGWISGAHSQYLVIDALPGSSMIGVHFKPGGAAPFLGLPAGELSDAVVQLDGIWSSEIWTWRDRLLAESGAHGKFRLLEQLLLSRLERARLTADSTKAVGWALDRFVREPHLQSIRAVTQAVGFSHKHFISSFRSQVGLTPKLFCRIRRFQQVIAQIHSRRSVDWADVVYSCGYYDQAHFVHDFAAFSGLNPSAYLAHRLEGEDRNFIRAAE